MNEPSHPAAVVVLAAGEGTRMRSRTPKVLHQLCGRSMIGHVLAAASAAGPEHVVVVVGHQRERVGAHVRELVPEAVLAVQEEQLGTAHALAVGLEELRRAVGEVAGTVVVTTGDTPLLTTQTLDTLVRDHVDGSRAATLLSARMEDPFGYGRVLRDEDGQVAAVVEQKDATPEQAAIQEVNAGIYAFDGAYLPTALARIGNENANAEFYLTDIVGVARAEGRPVGAHVVDDVAQTAGANDRVQLADLAAQLNRRVLEGWMRRGVTVVDPATTWVDVTVTLERDVTLLPGVQLHGTTSVGEGATVGPDSTLRDVEVGPEASVVRTHGERAVVGRGATVGPFSYLRPGTVLHAGGKIGTFVETKNATIDAGAKVPHLSYVGDAHVGEGSNIGAGTIFANYDGVAKHRTTVGRHARTGSNNTFVAPVAIGDGAVTGGGTVVRRDVPPGSLAVSAGEQRVIEEWVLRRRAGTPAADAAAAALAETGEEPPRAGQSTDAGASGGE